MASSSSQSSENFTSLRALLEEALTLYDKVEDSTEATSSATVQADIKRGIEICEEATRMVSHGGIFSGNEGLSDMATADIPYLLLPVLLGRFTSQLVSRDREELIRITEIYYSDFLQRTTQYGLCTSYSIRSETEKGVTSKPSLSIEDACKFRSMKLEKFNDKMNFKTLVRDLKKKLEGADESTRREYYISLVKYFVLTAIEEMEFLETEKDMREQMKKFRKGELKEPEKRPRQQALQAVIITKDMVQKAVYGAGYPSLPTMTVQEFYDKRVQDGVFPDPTKPKAGPMNLQEASLAGLSLEDEREKELAEEDSKVDNDDEEYIKMQRDKDEFKDDHRRGWGNRANRS